MAGAQAVHADGYGAFEQAARLAEVPLGGYDTGEIVKSVGGVRVIFTQAGLTDGHGTLKKGASSVEVAPGGQMPPCGALTIPARRSVLRASVGW